MELNGKESESQLTNKDKKNNKQIEEQSSNNDLYTDTIKVHNLLKLDDADPYCDKCEHTDADNINTEINGNVWKMCEI